MGLLKCFFDELGYIFVCGAEFFGGEDGSSFCVLDLW